LFLTRYMMPVLYSFFPAPAGHDNSNQHLIAGSHYSDRFLRSSGSSSKHLGVIDPIEDSEHQVQANGEIGSTSR
jgi:heavy metal efflux system protein